MTQFSMSHHLLSVFKVSLSHKELNSIKQIRMSRTRVGRGDSVRTLKNVLKFDQDN